MKIGIIVASHSEEEPFYEVFGKSDAFNCPANETKFNWIPMWEISFNKKIYLMRSGVGEILAAISTQFMIDNFGVDRIINYGVVGGLSEKQSAEKIGIVEKVVHYDYDISLCEGYVVGQYKGHDSPFIKPEQDAVSSNYTQGLDRLICASADKVVGAGEPKRNLRREFGADICDMESAGIVITCNQNGIPCTLIKAVSDGVDEDEEAFRKYVHSASKKCVEYVAEFIRQL